jgi:hypothetical protein
MKKAVFCFRVKTTFLLFFLIPVLGFSQSNSLKLMEDVKMASLNLLAKLGIRHNIKFNAN